MERTTVREALFFLFTFFIVMFLICILSNFFIFMQKIDKMFAAFTGQPLEKVQQYTERDRFLSASEVNTSVLQVS